MQIKCLSIDPKDGFPLVPKIFSELYQKIELLSKFPDDYTVVMSKDAEGNSYSPLVDVAGGGTYEADTPWSGEWISSEEEPEGDFDGMLKAICLWPAN